MSEFDSLVALQNPTYNSDYIRTCKSASRKPTKKTPVGLDDSVIIVSSDSRKRSLPKFKLLQFRENHRPAYYGSWRRAKGSVTPRNPLRKDESLLDYEVDSDDEWEEEEPGESLSSSEGEEKDGDAAEEDSDEDDGFFVPHGYLSNDEGDCSDSGEFLADPNEDRSETKKRKQLAKTWESEFARKCQPLEARVVGCMWLTEGPGKEFSNPDSSFLIQFAAVPLVPLPILAVPIATKGETSAQKGEGVCPEPQKHSVPEEAMPDLIRFLHRSVLGKKKIVRAFRIHWGAKNSVSASSIETPVPQSPGVMDSTPCPLDATPRPLPKIDSTPMSANNAEYQEYEAASNISKNQLEKKIQAIAVKEIRPPVAKLMWHVHGSVLKQYGLEQDNFVPLVSSGSPCLGVKLPDQTPSKTSSTPETPHQSKACKRKAGGGMGKSLLNFLSRSPVSKTSMSPCPQHAMVGASVSPPPPNDEVIILDPPEAKRDELTEPPAKRDKLAEPPARDKPAEPPAKRQATIPFVRSIKADRDEIVLDPPHALGQLVAKRETAAVVNHAPLAVSKETPTKREAASGNGVSEEVSEPPAKKPCLETTGAPSNNGGVGTDQNMTVLRGLLAKKLLLQLQSIEYGKK